MTDIGRISDPSGAWPAALTKNMAAAYCSLSPEVFSKVCPLKPLRFPAHFTGELYLRLRLDEWLYGLDENDEQVRSAIEEREQNARSPQPSAYGPRQLAKRWECSERHVRNMIKRGDLPAFKFGGKLLRVKSEDVDRFERGGKDDGEGAA